MTLSGIATRADCADALLVARRAKGILFWILLAVLLLQMAIFFAIRYQFVAVGDAATQPSTWTQPLQYVTGLAQFVGIALGIVLAAVLLMMVLVMVVGRVLGVARTTSALIWCLVLVVLLFPWQAFLDGSGLAGAAFKVPGVLYSWGEVVRDARFGMDVQAADWQTQITTATLKWARFAGFPAVAVLMLLVVQLKSSRGLRLALGETAAVSAEDVPGVMR